MKIDIVGNQNFRSSKIQINGNKKSFMDYVEVLPPKIFKCYSNKPINECLNELKTLDGSLGMLIGKDNCFYIFGKNQNQDKFIYDRLKKIDSNIKYLKDVTD